MWILLGIILFILFLVTVILLLPVSVIIKANEKGEFKILYKLLFKTFGEKPDPNNPIVKTLKEVAGVTRLDKEKLKQSVKEKGFLKTLNESAALILELIKKAFNLLKKCKLKDLKIDVICAEEDAAKTAIAYGRAYAIISPVLNFVNGVMKVRKKGQKINITPDFNGGEPSFSLEIVLTVSVFRVLIVFLQLMADEKKRKEQETVKKENQK